MNAMAPAIDAPEKPVEMTRFDFQARVFHAPGARFAMVEGTDEPRFFVDLGGTDASLAVDVLEREFDIPSGSPDSKLIQIAVKGLRFVDDICAGDAIPSEILNGQVSWKIKSKHKEIASQRLQVQLLSWVSGKEVLLTDADEIEMFLQQIENKTRLKAAFEAAADQLGFGAAGSGKVVDMLQTLARELCYIEALRERFVAVRGVAQRLLTLRRYYAGDPRIRDEIRCIGLLLGKALSEYDRMFGEVDAQTSEIIGALKSVDRQITYIRGRRDELYTIMRRWDPVLARWASERDAQSRAMDKLLSDTYRLLARKYAVAKSMRAA